MLRGKFHFLGERVLYKSVLRRYKDLPEATRSTKTANVGAIFKLFLPLKIFSQVANGEESMQICSAQSNVIITRQVRDILLSYSQSTAAHESRDIMPWSSPLPRPLLILCSRPGLDVVTLHEL